MSYINVVIKQIRAYHWIKNVLVFAPLFFVGELFVNEKLITVIQLFFAFSFLASTIYIINDIVDRKKDALHPKKKFRPIASGKMSIRTGIILSGILILATVFLSYHFNATTQILLLLYFILNIGYSFYLKHIAVLELFLISTMYVLRIVVGGTIVGILISKWLIMVSFFLALFFILGKRYAELQGQYHNEHITRKVLKEYSVDFLKHSLAIVITSIVVSYGLYTIEIENEYIIYTTFLVLFGMLRYLHIILDTTKGEAPEKLLFQDKTLLCTIVLWAGSMFYILYL